VQDASIRKDWYFSLTLWALARLVMAVGTAVYLLATGTGLGHLPFWALVYSQVHDDSGWFAYIAQEGYIAQDTAFFPLYPLLVGLVHRVIGLHVTLAGLVVSNIFMILDFFVVLRLFRMYFADTTARLAVALFALFPTAFFLSAMYTESLFIFAFCGALLCLAERRYVLAAVLGACAVLTRNTGILVLVPFSVALWREYRTQGRVPVRLVILSGLIPAALAAYCGYLWLRFGSPFLWSSVQHLWGREFMLPWLTLYQGFVRFPYLWQQMGMYGHVYYTIEILSVLFVLLLLPAVWRYTPREWFVVTVLMTLIPLCAPGVGISSIVTAPHRIIDYFFSFPRFVLAMFPVFAALAVLVQRVKQYAVAVSATALAGLMFPVCSHWFLA
jgi:hypothetical protein